MKLSGKVAIVTGGARGIGLAIVRRFLAEGAEVFIVDVGDTSKDAIQHMSTAEGSSVFPVEMNVTDKQSIAHAVKKTLDVCDRIDILVNNAGITRDATFAKMSDIQFEEVMRVNLFGVANMTRAVIPQMLVQKSGVILNASSAVARGNFGQTNYAAAKAAVESMTVTWARELGPKGIRVNAVAPGFTKTAMTDAVPEKAKAAVIAATPLGRFADPEEIAAVYAFLASDDASFINGAVIPVDGGLIV